VVFKYSYDMDKPKRKTSLKYMKKKSEVPRNRLRCTHTIESKKPCENKSDSDSSMNLQKHFVIETNHSNPIYKTTITQIQYIRPQ
jgi:hypothetical protein